MGGLIDYANLPPLIGMVISAERATLRELQEYYGVKDLIDLSEVIAVDSHNRNTIAKARNGNS